MIGEHLAAIEAAVMEALQTVGTVGIAWLLLVVHVKAWKWFRDAM